MQDKAVCDSNILLYGFSKIKTPKKLVAEGLLKNGDIYVSPQIIFECLNVLTKKFKAGKEEALYFVNDLLRSVIIVNEDEQTVSKAIQLYHKHSLQVYDSKIIAAALLSGCKILYSEDLQHGQVFER